MFRKIQLSLTPAQRVIRAAQRREYRETQAHRYPHPALRTDYEPIAPHRLDFHEDSNVDWSLLDTDDRFGGDY